MQNSRYHNVEKAHKNNNLAVVLHANTEPTLMKKNFHYETKWITKKTVIIIIINRENLGISPILGWEFNQIRSNMKQYTVEREIRITPMCKVNPEL